MPVVDIPAPSTLWFTLLSPDGNPLRPLVKEGDEVRAGQALAADGERPALVSPVTGKVISLGIIPDLRGARNAQAVVIEPAPGSTPAAFPPLDPSSASAEQLRARLSEAGVVTDAARPRPIGDVLWPAPNTRVDALVVLAADREPEQSSMLQAFRERAEDAMGAAQMLSRAAGAGRAVVAVPERLLREAQKIAERRGVELLPLVASYPQTLEPLVALRVGAGSVKIVAVETALAAWDAVARGRVQDRKVLTLSGPGRSRANYSVALGSRVAEVLAFAAVAPGAGDKVIAGGVMRGFAQYSLEAAVDHGVDAITLIRAAEVIPWSDEPCVNCGACVAVCPLHLQVHLVGRYAEFGIFDRAEEFKALSCIECGLCASVCTGRRPMLQMIRMAKAEIGKRQAAERARRMERERAAGAPPAAD